MPRRRASQTSTSSEQSNGSEHLNLTEEFPDAGLPKTRAKGGKKKKNVSFNLPKGGKKQDNINCVDSTKAKATATSSNTGAKNAFVQTEQPTKTTNDKQDLTEETQTAVNGPAKGKKNTTTNKPKAPEVKKLKHIDEKNVKVTSNQVNKMYKIGDCVKSMNIEIHPALFSAWYMAELPKEATAAGIPVLPAHDICDPCALMYTQNLSRTLTATDGQVRLTPSKAQCLRSLYIMTASEVANFVHSNALTEHIKTKSDIIGGTLTLIVLDPNHYFQKTSSRAHKGLTVPVNNVQLEMALTDVFVSLQIETFMVRSATELAQLTVNYARAIAEEPIKRSKREIDEQADFYMRGDNKNCVSVDKDGNGLSRLWQQMISVLPMSSLEISRSLTSEYGTPRALANELSSGGGAELVAEVGVARAGAASVRPRRLGPDFARKLHTLFTADDGDLLIQ